MLKKNLKSITELNLVFNLNLVSFSLLFIKKKEKKKTFQN